jgi:hypothetical protein
MNKAEVEELYIGAITSGETAIFIKMLPNEANVFRVLVGRVLKEMEKANKALYTIACDFTLVYKEPYLVISRREEGKFQLNKVGKGGELIPL